eukprot:TRINITY_DN2263_c0_g1_i9.p1 TRINITY_DN2263_c0_g1~~TRINITY_DN2263_c0_g1_i9.p1  ORF type:complete len:354 (-),score=62.22 TRINITY_DN2263_c0_g1_i9:221-1282(-)
MLVKLFLLALCSTVFSESDIKDKKGVYKKFIDALEKNDESEVFGLLDKLEEIDVLDDQGRAAMVSAVRGGSLSLVELIISVGASLNIQEKDGSTPLSVAFDKQLNDIARVIIKHGGNPNTTVSDEVKVRDFAVSDAAKTMLAQLDKDGFEFFEDQPGEWLRGYGKGNQSPFYYNVKSKSSAWRIPPSCSWTTHVGPHEHIFYVNTQTGQVKHVMPKALSWRYIEKEDTKPFWFNFATNFSMLEEPAELPPDMLEKAKKEKNQFWFNHQTQQISWVDPRNLQWRAIKHPEVDKIYYYHPETLEATWELPEELGWEEVEAQEEEHKGKTFYHNKVTGESQWQHPEHMAWKLHDEL